ncbi:18989_t:CDS:2 [Gigaspora margarita]|uniref:18989_t:CDS:1 n=1 Tax=Gigaspora margarita TaxID=4874 RepID=A0ABN7V7K2_GIGMA|nr:18989_t:CDS:2 [Gigaspora margarita]
MNSPLDKITNNPMHRELINDVAIEASVASTALFSNINGQPFSESNTLVIQALNSIRQEQLMIESYMIMPSGSASGVSENGPISLINHKEIKDVLEF